MTPVRNLIQDFLAFPSRPWLRAATFLAACLGIAISSWAQQQEDLEQAATGIVSRRCMACHDAEQRTSGLDLSRLEGAIEGGQGGEALVPGDPEASLMYQRVASGEMPLGNPLPNEEREILRRWVEAGAPWKTAFSHERKRADRTWWSLQPLKWTPPASNENAPKAWQQSPIDRWIHAGVIEKGLHHAPEADRQTLIRRAFFDLIGLPPSPEEIEAFASDPNPDAYEALIDGLLVSPRYGERWARHWLDVVRFGESHGYETNRIRDTAWPYRDYVIRSLNEDKPFDQMVLEQLAGDRVATGDPKTEAATGFLVAGPHDTVKIANVEGNRAKRANDLNDILTATAGAFLGLTVHCARCHNHKFDPIDQEDYYRMAAVFDGVSFGERPWAPPKEIARHASRTEELNRKLKKVEQELTTMKDSAALRLDSQRAGILRRFREPVDSKGTEERFPPVDARYLRMNILGVSKGKDVAVLDELEVWTAGDSSRNVALASTGARVTARATRIPDDDATAYVVEHVNDGRFDRYWWSDEPGLGQVTIELPAIHQIDRVFWSRDRQGAYGGIHLRNVPARYTIEVSTDGETWKQVADTTSRLPYDEAEREELLHTEVLTPDEKKAWIALAERVKELEAAEKALPPLPQAYIGAMSQPKEPTRLLARGNPMEPGKVLSPGSMSALAELVPPFELAPDAPESERRLELARWITHDNNALTARVLANRIWHYHFGTGLVATPNDFGFNGERPTHPELLDWLAARIQLLGWRWKPLHKEIMMSMTYRQSSRHVASHAELDRDARYLWRFPPRRLEAEVIRDSILAVSGKLDLRMGGPGFRLYRYTVDNVATYYPLDELDESTFRRSVYHQNVRAVKPGLLGPFDCPDSALSAPRREVTTSPLQALALLNGRFIRDQARFLAERIVKEAGSRPRGTGETGLCACLRPVAGAAGTGSRSTVDRRARPGRLLPGVAEHQRIRLCDVNP